MNTTIRYESCDEIHASYRAVWLRHADCMTHLAEEMAADLVAELCSRGLSLTEKDGTGRRTSHVVTLASSLALQDVANRFAIVFNLALGAQG